MAGSGFAEAKKAGLQTMTAARRYLITGGTSGIGAMCADHLTREGHRVWITGTQPETVATALQRGGAEGATVCDISIADDVDRAFGAARDALGGLDGVFLNAGIDGQCQPAERLDPQTYRRILDVNVVGTLQCAQAAYRTLERPGAIVINSSVNAVRSESQFADYNSSKAAVAAIASSLALEWTEQGLCVTCVCPGYFRTSMTEQYLDDPQVADELLARIPAGRFGRPSDVAATVSFLLGNEAPYLSGAAIPIAGAANV